MKHIILGGTGTLGQAVTAELNFDPDNQITIFSRGELEQQKMKSSFPECSYVIGDIKDKDSLRSAIRGHDYVYHFAALKHVDICEANPMEAVKTNVIGTNNVAEICTELGVKNLIFSTTDKAVLPINCYGYSKALAEKSLKEKYDHITKIFRWGNVIGSRGSVVPIFVKCILKGNILPITHGDMTRYWIRIEDAAKFLVNVTLNKPQDGIHVIDRGTFIPSMKGAGILNVIQAISQILEKPTFHFKNVGIRPGEKLHECLFTSHEYCLNSDDADNQYTLDELIGLLRPSVERIVRDIT